MSSCGYGSKADSSEFKVTIRAWHGVASWSWNGRDICAICYHSFDDCHPKAKFPGDDSAVAWGKCGHAFHIVCIQRMIDQQPNNPTPKCPYCRQDWEYLVDEAPAAPAP